MLKYFLWKFQDLLRLYKALKWHSHLMVWLSFLSNSCEKIWYLDFRCGRQSVCREVNTLILTISRAITAYLFDKFLKAILLWTCITKTLQMTYTLHESRFSGYPVIFDIEIYREILVSGSITCHCVIVAQLTRVLLTGVVDYVYLNIKYS
jgi:hypothetical protein